MNANMYIFKRSKAQGHYQDDIHDICIAELHGWDAVEYISLLANSCFDVEGSLVFNEENPNGRLLSSMEEYYSYTPEYDKHSFVLRIEQSFFDMATNLDDYDEWAEDYPWQEEGEERYLREELEALKEILPLLDFENNYYYVA